MRNYPPATKLAVNGETHRRKPTATHLFETRNRDMAAAHLADFFGKNIKINEIGNARDFHFHLSGARLGSARFGRAASSNWSYTRQMEDEVHITLALKGSSSYRSGRDSFEALPGRHATVGRPFENFSLTRPNGVGLILIMPFPELIRRAERLIGARLTLSERTNIPTSIDLRGNAGAALARNMKFAFSEIANLDSTGLCALARYGFEELLYDFAAAALFPRVGRELGPDQKDAGPRTVTRARDYIREHAADPIDFSRLAQDLGVSMRAMQENFRRHFQLSPRDYLIECRLELAYDRLTHPEAIDNVTEIALAAGFSDLSHFARKYREKYGELPSQTLRRAHS